MAQSTAETAPDTPAASADRPQRIVVIGSGTLFLSGISVYSVRLANALSAFGHRVGLLTMRRLIPARLYPGWKRVGADLTHLDRDPNVAHFDGVDWFWFPSLFLGAAFLLRRRPEIVIFEWWTGTIVHSYIALALFARLAGAKVIIEFHEIVPVEEARLALLARYVRTFAPVLFRMGQGYAVHSEFDRALVVETWGLDPATTGKPIQVLPHGPHDHYQADPDAAAVTALREAPAGVINLLFFGVIRPYKGLEVLVEAFEALSDDEATHFWLSVVGETWEGYTEPIEKIERSPRRARMTVVNRYVTDAELDGYMRGADAVVLPYIRSSLSGPLHVAMGYGLPIVMTDVGGNAEAAADYGGVVLVAASDAAALADALREVAGLAGTTFEHPHSWMSTAEAYQRLITALHNS
jgi:glycosyltransferase involved in cell wall biosynthesis